MADLPIDQLYNYTKDVSNQFSSAGITPKIISIGNESECLWHSLPAETFALPRLGI